jgi:hypothetical protein
MKVKTEPHPEKQAKRTRIMIDGEQYPILPGWDYTAEMIVILAERTWRTHLQKSLASIDWSEPQEFTIRDDGFISIKAKPYRGSVDFTGKQWRTWEVGNENH